MKNRIILILPGNNGATYILNASDFESIKYSLKFYKARTLKQRAMKLALNVFLVLIRFLPKLPSRFELKSVEETGRYLNSLTDDGIPFEFEGNCSALISPTRDKIIVHHHGNYFHKFAFGKSLERVKSEIGIYRRIGTKFSNFRVSEVSDTYESEIYCSFRLNNAYLRDRSELAYSTDFVSALAELFNTTSGQSCTLSQYLQQLRLRMSELDPITANSLIDMLAGLAERNNGLVIPLGLVHRDFKPWNIDDERGLLIYDFEEAVLDGPPLEDLFNYFVDPLIRYTTAKEMMEELLRPAKMEMFSDYLRRMNLDLDFKMLLLIYIIERVLFWAARDEMDTALSYQELFKAVLSTRKIL